jgi:hypothetical protein
VTGDSDSRSEILEDESSRLKDALKSCRTMVANYRAMLTDGSNDNAMPEPAPDDPEVR